jgi:hypothetical protein
MSLLLSVLLDVTGHGHVCVEFASIIVFFCVAPVAMNNVPVCLGTGWEVVPYPEESIRLKQVSVGRNSVWALGRDGKVREHFRYFYDQWQLRDMGKIFVKTYI